MSTEHDRIRALSTLLADASGAEAVLPLVQPAIDLVDDLVRLGHAREALDLLRTLQAKSQVLSDESVARLTVLATKALLSTGAYTEAYEALVAVSKQLNLSEGSELGDKLQILYGTCLWMINRPSGAIEVLEQLRGRLLQRADSANLADCTIQLSAAHWVLGEYRTAMTLAMDGVVSARRTGNRHIYGQSLVNYSRQARQLCRWSEAREAAEEAIRLFDELGNLQQMSHALRSLAILEWKRGQLSEAHRKTERLAELAGENTVLLSMARLLKIDVLIHQGLYEDARRIIGSIPGWSVVQGQSRAAILAAEYLGDIMRETGDVKAAQAQFDKTYTEALAVAPKSDLVGDLLVRRAECLLLNDAPDTACTIAAEALKHWRRLGERYEEAATYRILALSAAAIGKPDEAKKWFDEGFAIYDEIETPYEWGKLWMAYGDWLSGSHAGAYADRRGALEAYHAARDHFERMGAEGKLKQADERIGRLEKPISALAGPELRHTPRRPRRATELERRSTWAFENFRIVTRSRPMLALLDDVAKLAVSQTPMLVLGESGTGKELIARGIHTLSGRKGPFMAINAGSLPREIIESELFGHMAGSFTGASRDKPGIFEVCDKGTVFLDEIAEMSVDLQSRLLRFLETGESRRVGSNVNIAVDSRIIAATNRERSALERGENFRVDLYYRLAHAVISLPPLRQRGDDVEMLADYFLEEACAASRKDIRFSAAALRRMAAYSWPGNVRQLRALVKRLVLLGADGHEVSPDELQLENAEVPTTLIQELEQAEKRRVAEALGQARGSRTEAARILGMPRTTLINKIKRYGLV